MRALRRQAVIRGSDIDLFIRESFDKNALLCIKIATYSGTLANFLSFLLQAQNTRYFIPCSLSNWRHCLTPENPFLMCVQVTPIEIDDRSPCHTYVASEYLYFCGASFVLFNVFQ